MTVAMILPSISLNVAAKHVLQAESLSRDGAAATARTMVASDAGVVVRAAGLPGEPCRIVVPT